MNTRWRLLILVLGFIVLAATAHWWLAPLLSFAKINSDVIQSLEALVSMLMVVGGLVSAFVWWRRGKSNPLGETRPQQIFTGGGDFVGRDQNKLDVTGGISGGTLVVGNDNTINNQTTVNVLDGKPAADPSALRRDYLNHVFETAGVLQLAGIDPEAARESGARLSLDAVYTALLTQTPEEQDHLERISLDRAGARKLSALEQLNRHTRLVLLGDPGSGKSTFVNFVALCLAGDMLGKEAANLKLLTAPLPKEPGDREDPPAQPWDYPTLLPVRVVLRDFAASGILPSGQPATAAHLWAFLTRELERHNLVEYAPHLNKELHERGGLLLVDGLDEVPEAEQRRAQIKQAVEGFAHSYQRVRILVTSRTYAYQKQDWQLNGFQTAVLASFSRAQIEQFITRWYAHIAAARSLTQQDAQGKAALLKQAVFGSDRLMGLAERPLLLTLMASLHAWRGGTLPEKREELYADAVDLLLNLWESQRVVRGSKGELVLAQPSLVEWLKVDRQKVRDLLNELAYQVHQAQSELVGTADVPQGDLVNGLMRLANNPEVNPARLVEYLRDRAGLLLPRGEGVFTFPHRTFQEYLAACYLTEHLEPDQIAVLYCQDRERWREALLLAAAKATKGMALGFWALIEELCPGEPHPGPCSDDALLWGAHLAGQALAESADLERISPRNRGKVERVRGWLVHILREGELPARERAQAGNNLARLGDPRFRVDAWSLPDEDLLGFVEIPAGPFVIGSDPKKDQYAQDREQPQHMVSLPGFWIARYPVTAAQYRAFVEDSGYQTRDTDSLRGVSNHPVVLVTWHDALAYFDWLTSRLRGWPGTPEPLRGALKAGGRVTLPSEAELEKAARFDPEAIGNQARIYPWGDIFDAECANTSESKINAASAVGCFPGGASPSGIHDLSGNVFEWTRSLWGKDWSKPKWKYPYDPEDRRRENLRAGDDILRVLRGGSWNSNERYARCAYRGRLNPNYRNNNFGFRVVVLPSSTLKL